MRRVTVGILLLGISAVAAGVWILQNPQAAASDQDPIVQVDAYPTGLKEQGWSAVESEVNARLSDWTTKVGITEMSEKNLVDGIDELSRAIAARQADYDFLWLRELMFRRDILCQRLPQTNSYRTDYCSDSSGTGYSLTG